MSASHKAACTLLGPDSSAHAEAVRALSQARHAAEAQRIRTLRPRLCRNALALASIYGAFLLWTVATPSALLTIAKDHSAASYARALWILGWSMLATGSAYLLWVLWPILTRGMLCRPRAPANAGPFLREKRLLQVDAAEGSSAETAVPTREPSDSAPNGVTSSNSSESKADSPMSARVLLPQGTDVRVSVEGRCVYILYNSFGVHGQKCKRKAEEAMETLTRAGACVHPLITQYAGHLYDLGRDPLLLPLERPAPRSEEEDDGKSAAAAASPAFVACVVIIGGDGSFSEYVNGYLERCAALSIPVADRTPVCLIPGGTGNSFCRDLYCGNLSADHALNCLLTGCVKRVDVAELRDEAGLRMISTNVVSWGLIGDTAVVAEDFRQFGDARYDVCAIWFVLRQITCRGRVVLHHLGGSFNSLRSVAHAPARKVSFAAEHTTAFFSLTQHFAKALRAAPHAKLDDGLVDVIIGDGGVRRRHLLTMFQQLPPGAHLGNTAVSHFQVQRVQLHPDETEEDDVATHNAAADKPKKVYVINVDGENKVVTGALDVTCVPRQMPVCAPLAMA